MTSSAQKAVLVGPALSLLLLLVIVPLGLAIRDSLHGMDLSVPSSVNTFVGDQHYRELVAEEGLSTSFWMSLRFAVSVTLLEVGLGLPLGIWIFRLHGNLRRFVESVLLFPLLTAPVIVGLSWLLLLQPDYGLVPGLLDLQFSFLASPLAATWTIRWVDIWQWTPFVALLCLMGLRGVPTELRESAQVDRLNCWHELKAIDLPYVLPVLGVAALLRFLEAFKVYDTVAVLTNGGPGEATDMISLALSRLAFQQGRFGYAAAATLVLDYLVIVAATALFALLSLRRRRA